MTGHVYRGHFDLWLINELQELHDSEITHEVVPHIKPISQWVNGNQYIQTSKVFGILPIPTMLIESAIMLPSDTNNPPKKYPYLACRQGTQFAVLTLHTNDEKALKSYKSKQSIHKHKFRFCKSASGLQRPRIQKEVSKGVLDQQSHTAGREGWPPGHQKF